eukprot:TRINITY_DN9308_c0_g1_i1.p1 TRINITY_DN9308_c0_g1~~TRINITY_DN9308_c0_g1_i1.p1  ORF type:complete len:912 (+),score=166.86 TRINITY_DN9308_c0_g1_i1:555-3290(+)
MSKYEIERKKRLKEIDASISQRIETIMSCVGMVKDPRDAEYSQNLSSIKKYLDKIGLPTLLVIDARIPRPLIDWSAMLSSSDKRTGAEVVSAVNSAQPKISQRGDPAGDISPKSTEVTGKGLSKSMSSFHSTHDSGGEQEEYTLSKTQSVIGHSGKSASGKKSPTSPQSPTRSPNASPRSMRNNQQSTETRRSGIDARSPSPTIQSSKKDSHEYTTQKTNRPLSTTSSRPQSPGRGNSPNQLSGAPKKPESPPRRADVAIGATGLASTQQEPLTTTRVNPISNRPSSVDKKRPTIDVDLQRNQGADVKSPTSPPRQSQAVLFLAYPFNRMLCCDSVTSIQSHFPNAHVNPIKPMNAIAIDVRFNEQGKNQILKIGEFQWFTVAWNGMEVLLDFQRIDPTLRSQAQDEHARFGRDITRDWLRDNPSSNKSLSALHIEDPTCKILSMDGNSLRHGGDFVQVYRPCILVSPYKKSKMTIDSLLSILQIDIGQHNIVGFFQSEQNETLTVFFSKFASIPEKLKMFSFIFERTKYQVRIMDGLEQYLSAPSHSPDRKSGRESPSRGHDYATYFRDKPIRLGDYVEKYTESHFQENKLSRYTSVPLCLTNAEDHDLEWDSRLWLRFFEEYDRLRKGSITTSNRRGDLSNVRPMRVVVMMSTIRAIQKGFYTTATGASVNLNQAKPTVFYRVPPRISTRGVRATQCPIQVINEDCLLVAGALSKSRKRVAVLNLASAYSPGGGYKNGDAAQEEVLMRRSNYCTSLDSAWCSRNPSTKSENYPLSEYGGAFTEDVTVFRGPEKDGYEFMQVPFSCSFIAVSGVKLAHGQAFNMEHAEITAKKIETIFHIAIENQVQYLVLGALGCGAYNNPPKTIAGLFRAQLEIFAKYFDKVIFAILDDHNSTSNFSIFKRVLDDENR